MSDDVQSSGTAGVSRAVPADARAQLLARLRGTRRLTGHAVIARELQRLGVTHVYGIAGVPVDETLTACRRAGLSVVAARHQQAAVFAAAAHNWIAGGLRAVVVVSSGPAVTNCTTGILLARDNGWPLLVIGGRRSPALDDRGGFQALDAVTLFGAITRQARLVESPDALTATLAELVRQSLAGRPSPCYADVTVEALEGYETLPASAPAAPVPAPAGALPAEVLAMLRAARRPLILLGDDLRFGGTFDAAARLVERLGRPWLTTPALRGLLPDGHPLCATLVMNSLIGEADGLLVLGARFGWPLRHGAGVAATARIVRLGFGTDPVVAQHPGSVDHDMDPSQAVQRLLAQLEAGALPPAEPVWLARLQERRDQWQARRAHAHAAVSGLMTPASLLRELAAALPDDCRVILDGNLTMAWADRLLEVSRPLRRLTAGANGCMGTGVPFALASCMAEPDVPVVVIAGDFAMGVCLQDLETAVRHQLPLVVVVVCNGGMGGRLRQQQFGLADGTDPLFRFGGDCRFDQVMIALGGAGERIDQASAVAPVLRHALASGRPAVLHVDVRDDAAFPDF